ncbi:MAG: hypothetical protein ACI9WU_000494 [Myxococcota bacterium]|jgi:hypothetical protein
MKRLSVFGASLVTCCIAVPAMAQTGLNVSGDNALESNTFGDYNSAFGDRAGQEVTSSSNGTFIGYGACRWVTDDADNTCIGYGAGAGGDFISTDPDLGAGDLTPLPNGVDNVFVGARAGLVNLATDNTFIGSEAGYDVTSGFDNTFVGEQAGYHVTTGDDNTFLGEDAGYNGTTGEDNTAIGSTAMRSLGSAWANTAVGKESLYDATDGANNTAIGTWSGSDIGAGMCNTTLGSLAGANTEHADFSTFVGFMAGWDNNRTNSTGNAIANTYLGSFSGMTNRDGSLNTIVGAYADMSNVNESTAVTSCTGSIGWPGAAPTRSNSDTDVHNVTAIGASIRITGNDAVGVGYGVISTGSRGIAIGALASSTHTDAIVIGFNADSHGNEIMVLGNDDTKSIDPDADAATALGSSTYRYTNVYAQAGTLIADDETAVEMVFSADLGEDNDDSWKLTAENGGAFTVSSLVSGTYATMLSIANTGDLTVSGDVNLNSDARLKTDVDTLVGALDLVSGLVGRMFRWRPELHRGDDLHFGFIAQEVAEIMPELVHAKADGTLTVNYIGVIPVLVNAVRDLRDQVDSRDDQLVSLRAQVRSQEARLQRLEAALGH